MKEAYRYLKQQAEAIRSRIQNPKLREMFGQCFLNTIETTTRVAQDGTTYVFTGDIPAMWLRDSSAQVMHYLPYCRNEAVAQLVSGLVRRQMRNIRIDAYANAFNETPNGQGHTTDVTRQNPWVFERKYEIDSLCYPIMLAYRYWKVSGDASVFNDDFQQAVRCILAVWTAEQHHETSPYSFWRADPPEQRALVNHGKGNPVGFTGMTWSGFRPSDDPCQYGYLIPSNMFAVVVLRYLAEIGEDVLHDAKFAEQCGRLKDQLESGIRKYGVVQTEKFGPVYAYETDGLGHHLLMDDANVPSLLSLPYLGYCTPDDPIYRNTRRFILSTENPYYFEGKFACGVGSPHTEKGYIWPISLIMQALTSQSPEEISRMFQYLLQTDAGTGFIHESFCCEKPALYTRKWFAWANSLFATLIVQQLDHLDSLICDEVASCQVSF